MIAKHILTHPVTPSECHPSQEGNLNFSHPEDPTLWYFRNASRRIPVCFNYVQFKHTLSILKIAQMHSLHNDINKYQSIEEI